MDENGTTRLETFSDGVFAIAATLLVLEFSVDAASGPHLGDALLHLWPSYLAYATSFLTIGIIWINHHYCVETFARADRTLLFLITRGFNPGVPMYGLVFLVAVFSPLASVILTFVIAAFYLPSAALFSER